MWSSFFPKENLIHLDHTLPHYIQILFIHYVLLFAEILPILNITSQNAKNALEFLKKYFCLQRAKALLHLAYLLWSEFQGIIWTLKTENHIWETFKIFSCCLAWKDSQLKKMVRHQSGYHNVWQLAYAMYVHMPNFIGVCILFDMRTLTCMLIFSL